MAQLKAAVKVNTEMLKLVKKKISSFSLPITIFFIPLPPKHQEQYMNLHQPSTTATVVKIRCGNKFNFKNKSL